MSLLKPVEQMQIIALFPGVIDDPKSVFGVHARPLLKHQAALANARRRELSFRRFKSVGGLRTLSAESPGL